MDFTSDALIDGRTFRILNVMDDYNRECLLSQGSISFPAKRVINYLEQLKEEVGLPNYIRTDNGPEFTSNDYKDWCKINNVTCLC
ncbi:MAG: transposase family protein [Saprospiraceae bacterium]|nr:transposase family protein [Saprospiraceae bacterium]